MHPWKAQAMDYSKGRKDLGTDLLRLYLDSELLALGNFLKLKQNYLEP